MKRNTEDLQDFLRDLGNWEDEIKKEGRHAAQTKTCIEKGMFQKDCTQYVHSYS